MSKKKLFDDDSEEEVAIKTENEYAKKYDSWREKEELHKLEQKYGSKALDPDASSSDSEDESDEPPEVSEEMEAQFLKTLSLLKTKDPRIYDSNFKCFDEKEEKVEEKKLEIRTLTFEDSEEDSDSDGNIFKIEKKAEILTGDTLNTSDLDPKGGRIQDYLTGKTDHIQQDVEKDLAPLRALWSDPKLNDGEAFLRDYILNKRYLEEGDAGEAEEKIRDDEELDEDEKRVEEQGQFERAYNFRFEEPDQEYLKRFPRTMNYIRPKDESRARKRAEVRKRKEDEKKRKMEEIARMKALKLKEIQEKIARIKEVTGNEELAFKEEDIEGDFDPEEHDRRMKALFDEQFYGEADDEKPVFPDLDEELEIENWDKYETEHYHEREPDVHNEDGPHCEDDDFNMDADYDPRQARANLLEEIQSTLGSKRRNRKKKSKLAKILEEEKPKFIPRVNDKTYNDYMEEYYKMDCEDVIGGDLPTRFKYREVVPNDFGLTIEEILLADDKELTQWVPLKKIVKHRPVEVEKSEVNTYRIKASDERLKKKILPSLFTDLPDEPEIVVPIEEATKKKKKKKKNKDNSTDNPDQSMEITDDIQSSKVQSSENTEQSSKKKKKKHREEHSLDKTEPSNNDSEIHNTEPKDKEYTKKEKHKNSSEVNEDVVHREKHKNSENHEENTSNLQEHRQKVDNKNKNQLNHEESARTMQATDTTGLQVQNVILSNESTMINGEGIKKKKKKHKIDGFTVERVQNQTPK
ncbi:protein KRI1 homolog [Hyposmocoma kahamanoa]|uniref:protein KRI1 homolog n=1 Tax=Hyposmocoma kahamanoa TaxID=1477025 RepID=UPI000E6DA3BB|nr:protein KRI1 homolog [Hyposmocoma kahamanoa]